MRVGFLGGTFDPVHKGHLSLGQAAQKQLRLDRVYFVLSPRSPFKLNRVLTPARLRFQMLKAALKPYPKFSAADWEMKRSGPSYTIHTLKSYRRKHPADKIHLIVGSDTYKGLRRWKDLDGILACAVIAVARRPGALRFNVPKRLAESTTILKGRFPRISSTELRRRNKNV